MTVDLSQFYFYKDQPNLPPDQGPRGRATASSPTSPASEIDFQSKLAGRGLEIVWIDSLVDIFFLHIQGSGIVQLEDGSRIYVGYADQNGHPFRSIGKYLLDKQLIDRGQLSLQGMKAFLKEHPEAIPAALTCQSQLHFFPDQRPERDRHLRRPPDPLAQHRQRPAPFPARRPGLDRVREADLRRGQAHRRLGEIRPLRPQPGHRRRHPRRRPRRPVHRQRRAERARRRRHEAEGALFFLLKKESSPVAR